MRTLSDHLPPVLTASSACPQGACSTPGCPLPRGRASGLCAPCLQVQAGTAALCQRLLARDLARLEWRAPGLTAAAQIVLRGTLFVAPETAHKVRAGERIAWPAPGDMAALEALLVELRERAGRS
jgi:hypothetical protein